MKKSTPIKKEVITPELKELNKERKKAADICSKNLKELLDRAGVLRKTKSQDKKKVLLELKSLDKLSITISRNTTELVKIDKKIKATQKGIKNSGLLTD